MAKNCLSTLDAGSETVNTTVFSVRELMNDGANSKLPNKDNGKISTSGNPAAKSAAGICILWVTTIAESYNSGTMEAITLLCPNTAAFDGGVPTEDTG